MKTAHIVKALLLASTLLYTPAASSQVEPGAFNHDFLVTSPRVAALLDVGDLDPGSPAWRGPWAAAPVTPVRLMWKITATVNQEVFSNTSGTRVVNVQSVNDGVNIAFKMVFADPTKSDSIADVPRFHDSLALAFPFSPVDSPFFAGCVGGPDQFDMIHMGNPCNGDGGLQCCPTGLLFWRADKGTRPSPTQSTVPGPSESEVLSANSPGTVHELAETDTGVVFTWAAYDSASKRWTVVVVRPLVSPPPLPPPDGATIICREGIVGVAPLHPDLVCTPVGNLPSFTRGTFQVVFANWDGGQAERNGLKFIGQWGDLLVQ
jgi:hypothetical protein